MKLKWVWTVPNVLSLMRIALVPVFATLYLMSEENPVLLGWSIAALCLSGITDLFDGIIARKFNQISEIGKILDPIADKLTQVTVILCLAIRLPRLWPLVILCGVKELLQAIGALLMLLRGNGRVQAAKWYGKVSTFVFYVSMGLFVAFPLPGETPLLFNWNMPEPLFIALVILVAACMAFACYQYASLFLRLMQESKTPDASDDGTPEV